MQILNTTIFFSGLNDELYEDHHVKEILSTVDLIIRAVRRLLNTTIYKSDNHVGRFLGEGSSFFSFLINLILLKFLGPVDFMVSLNNFAIL